MQGTKENRLIKATNKTHCKVAPRETLKPLP
jgi:hypothetical protein